MDIKSKNLKKVIFVQTPLRSELLDVPGLGINL